MLRSASVGGAVVAAATRTVKIAKAKMTMMMPTMRMAVKTANPGMNHRKTTVERSPRSVAGAAAAVAAEVKATIRARARANPKNRMKQPLRMMTRAKNHKHR